MSDSTFPEPSGQDYVLSPAARKSLDDAASEYFGMPLQLELRSSKSAVSANEPPLVEDDNEAFDCLRIRRKADLIVERLQAINSNPPPFNPFIGELPAGTDPLLAIREASEVLAAEEYLVMAEQTSPAALLQARECFNSILVEAKRRDELLHTDVEADRAEIEARLRAVDARLASMEDVGVDSTQGDLAQMRAVTAFTSKHALDRLEFLAHLSEFDTAVTALTGVMSLDIYGELFSRQERRAARRRRRRQLRTFLLLLYGLSFVLIGVGLDQLIGFTTVAGVMASTVAALLLWALDRYLVAPILERRARADQVSLLSSDPSGLRGHLDTGSAPRGRITQVRVTMGDHSASAG